jgi:hypothetical protein
VVPSALQTASGRNCGVEGVEEGIKGVEGEAGSKKLMKGGVKAERSQPLEG